MKLRISRTIRAARRRTAPISAQASISTGLDESLNRLAFCRNLKNEKNANSEQLPLNQKDTCKIAAFETPPEPQPS